MISIKVPPLGESITEATVARWLKDEGDAVAAGDTLVELETDKITVEVPALKAGVLAKRSRQEGDVVNVDDTLGELDETSAGAPARAPDRPAERKAPAPTQPAAQAEEASAPAARTSPAAQSPAETERARVSPAAQRVAAQAGIDPAAVTGTGRGGVVSKPDVVEHAARGAPTTTAQETRSAARTPPAVNGARETREKMSTRRRRIAEHLLEAKQSTASLTTFNEIDMSAVMQLRQRMRERVEKQHGVKLTFVPFFVKAACLALAEIPVLNAQVEGDSILYKHYVNMGIAVASEQGLVVPSIKDADRKGLIALSRDLADVATRARDGKLTMDDLTGGTFTISNGGVFGSLLSTPILNHPQVGILGLHKIEDRPVVIGGSVQVRPMMYVALSYDHRIVDGQHSVQFLVKVKEYVEDPAAMLLE